MEPTKPETVKSIKWFICFAGSTLISVILEKNRFLTVINVGDSRAVACDSFGSAIALSADHKPSDVTVLCYGILCLKRIDRKNDKFSREKMENKVLF